VRRVRRNVYFVPEHARGLERLAGTHGLSFSAVVGRAVASLLSPDAEHQREAAVSRRLDRLARQFERLERDQTIVVETLALFVRHHLTVVPPVPEAHAEAARAQGRARFEQFIEQLALHLQRGQRVRDAIEECVPSEDAFVAGRAAEGEAP